MRRCVPSPDRPQWLKWVSELRSIAEAGLAYSRDPYDQQRFAQLQELAAEIVASYTGTPETRVVLEAFQADSGYVTPKIDVRGVVFREGRVLMVKERSDGCWTFPGGWVEPGESPREAVEKEVREESGYEVRATRILAIDERGRHGHPHMLHTSWKIFMLCELTGGKAAADGFEIDEVGWFSETAIPPLSQTRVVPEQVKRMFSYQREGRLITEFD